MEALSGLLFQEVFVYNPHHISLSVSLNLSAFYLKDSFIQQSCLSWNHTVPRVNTSFSTWILFTSFQHNDPFISNISWALSHLLSRGQAWIWNVFLKQTTENMSPYSFFFFCNLIFCNLKIEKSKGLLWGSDGKRICLQCERPELAPWVRKIPWGSKWQPTPVFLPGEFHGQRSLAGCSPGSQRVGHNWATNTHTV